MTYDQRGGELNYSMDSEHETRRKWSVNFRKKTGKILEKKTATHYETDKINK